MLVRITNRCRMQCSHCMVEAHPEGDHMTPEVMVEVLQFVKRVCRPEMLLLSGGEPTEHPGLIDFLTLCRVEGIPVLLLSNGMFLHEDEKRRDDILLLVHGVQVTNDSRYYPKDVADFDHPKVMFERRLRVLSPFGRARSCEAFEPARQSPLCFNLRSMVRSGMSLSVAMLELRSRNYWCTPSINVDGSVVSGEAPSCTKIGEVDHSEAELTDALVAMTCNRCGLASKLNQQQKFAIGESPIAPPY